MIDIAVAAIEIAATANLQQDGVDLHVGCRAILAIVPIVGAIVTSRKT